MGKAANQRKATGDRRWWSWGNKGTLGAAEDCEGLNMCAHDGVWNAMMMFNC